MNDLIMESNIHSQPRLRDTYMNYFVAWEWQVNGQGPLIGLIPTYQQLLLVRCMVVSLTLSFHQLHISPVNGLDVLLITCKTNNCEKLSVDHCDRGANHKISFRSSICYLP